MTLIALLLAMPPCLATETPPAAPEATTAGAVDQIVQRVQARYQGVESLHASFVQVTKSQIYGDEEQRGTVILQRPNLMHWRFEGDGKQFVTDGDTMWIYNATDKQVIRYSGLEEQSGTAADSLLQSLHKVGELFDVEVLPAEVGHRLKLEPKDAASKATLKAVVLVLDPELVVKQVVITDPFDSVTELTFSEVKLGEPVPEGTFIFEVPAGVEVIESGGAG